VARVPPLTALRLLTRGTVKNKVELAGGAPPDSFDSSPSLIDAGALFIPGDRPVIVRRPKRAPGVRDALHVLFGHSDLFRALTAHRIRVRYKQSALGLCWAVLQPVSLMLIFWLVFGRIARVPSEGIPYPLFAYTGLLVWSFVAASLTNATHSVVGHAQLITKVSFPREILPLSYVAAAMFDMGIAGAVLAGLLAYHGHALTWYALYAVPVLAILAALVMATAFLLAAIQVRFRDVGIAVPLILYLWMFSTPIAYPLSAVPDAYRTWFLLNPMTGIVESFRRAVVHAVAPDPQVLAVPAIAAVILLPVAYAFFKRVETTMADVI
jgi:lipopolysaccharide transport system permease protein